VGSGLGLATYKARISSLQILKYIKLNALLLNIRIQGLRDTEIDGSVEKEKPKRR
jgi:hypothetical protein